MKHRRSLFICLHVSTIDEYGNTTKQKRRRKPDLSDDSVDVKRPRSISHSPPKSVSSESDSDRQPTPIPPAIVFDHFENDDTIYQIEDVTDETSIEDRCRIYSVAAFPTTDLTELQPGDPPDEDFSKAKPANQVMHATFSSYIEPYFRNFTEEDLAFLRERGDRVAPYTIPPLGQHYSEVWASDDAPVFASPAPPQLHSIGSKGAPDMLTDDMLEKEEISLGPLMSRILAGMIFEENVGEGGGGSEGANGSSSNMTNGDTPNHISGGSSSTLPGWQDAAFKTNLPKTDYTTLESRLKQEMRFIGLIGPNEDEPDWKAVEDDEISARLRALQGELRKQSILNGARKARLQHLLKEQLAWQEYATILDDLDKQVCVHKSPCIYPLLHSCH